MKNTYLIKLKLQIGEYEKSSVHLVESEHSTLAVEAALKNECHHDIGEGAEFMEIDQMEDAHGEMVYRLYSMHKVDPEDVDTLRKYL